MAEVEGVWKLSFIYASPPHIHDSEPSLPVSFRLSSNYYQQNFVINIQESVSKRLIYPRIVKNYLPALPYANDRRPMPLLQYSNIGEKEVVFVVEVEGLWKLNFIYTSPL